MLEKDKYYTFSSELKKQLNSKMFPNIHSRLRKLIDRTQGFLSIGQLSIKVRRLLQTRGSVCHSDSTHQGAEKMRDALMAYWPLLRSKAVGNLASLSSFFSHPSALQMIHLSP